MELEALGEELRVLYVALTRAKEKLILTASSRKLEDRIAKWSAVATEHGAIPYTILTLASSYLDWILMSIPEKNPWISYQMETLSDQIDREIGTQIRQTLSREWLRWLAGEDSHLSNDENHPNTQNRLENIRQIESIISSNYHFQYPYLDDLSLNTKMSVSELKKKGMEEERGGDGISADAASVYGEGAGRKKAARRAVQRTTVCCSCCRLSGQCRDRS